MLATCHFRIYRSLGGDANDVNRRKFAARATSYLILRTIGALTPATNPNDPDVWCEVNAGCRPVELDFRRPRWRRLQQGDPLGVRKAGKLSATGSSDTGDDAGAPPAVDVYIDDGRAGEYPFQHVHWHNQSMWNRNATDGLRPPERASTDATNYMYVKVKNRGTTAASNVTVNGFHCLPGAGLTWPNDFTSR